MGFCRKIVGGVLAAVVAGSCASAQTLTTELIASGIDRPVIATAPRGDESRLFVIEQEGAIRLIKNGVLLPTPFLDIDGTRVTGGDSGGDERGLLGLTFAPDYASSGKFYVNYTGTSGGQLTTFVDEYQRDANNPDIADPTSRRAIISFPQFQSNHNGGWIGFSPIDGFLYIATGDGGSGNDPQNNAANTNRFLGKMLRIDVSSDLAPYLIPESNPFFIRGGLREIWAYGLRNPWRCGFDRVTGDLWIADVGQNAREELNFQPASSIGEEHYGWRCREGFIQTPGVGCPLTPNMVDPVLEINHSTGACSIVAGPGYRGCELGAEFQGRAFYIDYCSGILTSVDPNNGFAAVAHANFGFGTSSIGEDARGEQYICRLFDGTVLKIVNPNVEDDDGNMVPDACQCLADLNDAASPNPGSPNFGMPDGAITPTDFAAFALFFQTGDLRADLNTASAASPAFPNWAVPDGILTPTDFTAFSFFFQSGCP